MGELKLENNPKLEIKEEQDSSVAATFSESNVNGTPATENSPISPAENAFVVKVEDAPCPQPPTLPAPVSADTPVIAKSAPNINCSLDVIVQSDDKTHVPRLSSGSTPHKSSHKDSVHSTSSSKHQHGDSKYKSSHHSSSNSSSHSHRHHSKHRDSNSNRKHESTEHKNEHSSGQHARSSSSSQQHGGSGSSSQRHESSSSSQRRESSRDRKHRCSRCYARQKIKKAHIGVQCRRDRTLPKLQNEKFVTSTNRCVPVTHALDGLKYGKYMRIDTYPNGGASIVHMHQEDLNHLSPNELNELAHEFFEVSCQ